jgi:MFS transporter, YNFM family, putative membrane transport protein
LTLPEKTSSPVNAEPQLNALKPPHLQSAFKSQFRAVTLGGFCSMASARVCDSMLPVLASELGGTVSTVSLVIASFAFAYGLSQLLYGPLGDRYGKLQVIFYACLGACLGAAACALAFDLTSLTWVRFFAGATAAGVIPLAIAWIGDSVPYGERQVVMAKFMAGTVTGLILGQILGGLASDTVGWRGAFWIIALMYAISALRLWMERFNQRPSASKANDPQEATVQPVEGSLPSAAGSLPSAADTSPTVSTLPAPVAQPRFWWSRVFTSYWEVLKKPAARLVLPVVMAEGFLVFSAVAFVPSFVHDRDAVSLSWASLAVAGFGVGGLVYAWRSQIWLKRLGETGFAKLGASLFGIGLCVLALLPGFSFALMACFVAGIGFYMLHNTLQTLGSQVSPESRGSAMSLFAFSLFAGQTIGISCAAWAVEHFGYFAIFLASGVCTVALGFVLAAGLEQKPDRETVRKP